MASIEKIFSRNLRIIHDSRHKRNGLGQKDSADALGVTQGSISKWLRGELLPKGDTVWRISKNLNVPMQDLFVAGGAADEVLVNDHREEFENFSKDPIFSLLVEDFKDFKLIPEKHKREILSAWSHARMLLKNRLNECFKPKNQHKERKSPRNNSKGEFKNLPLILKSERPVLVWEWYKNDFYLILYDKAAEKLSKYRLSGFLGTSAKLAFSTQPELLENMLEP